MNNKSTNTNFVQNGSLRSNLTANTTKHIMDNDAGKTKKERKALRHLKSRLKRK